MAVVIRRYLTLEHYYEDDFCPLDQVERWTDYKI